MNELPFPLNVSDYRVLELSLCWRPFMSDHASDAPSDPTIRHQMNPTNGEGNTRMEQDQPSALRDAPTTRAAAQ
ncbi:hypothetical protein ACWERW_00985 [Streptomyces sp. NPDC004012]